MPGQANLAVLTSHSIEKGDENRPFRSDDEGYIVFQDYPCAIARGLISGAEAFYGFGERITTGAITNGLIWSDGTLYLAAAAGVQPSIASTSANDAAAGTGIRTIEVHYLDANLAHQHEIVTLNGVTPVLMVATNVRFINDMHATTVGSGGMSAGVITASFGGVSMNQIKASDIRARSSARMVPAGKRAFIHSMVGGMVSGTASANGHIDVVATELDGDQFAGLFFPFGAVALQDNSATLGLPMPGGPFQAGTIIAMTATVDKAAHITGTWYGWVENA